MRHMLSILFLLAGPWLGPAWPDMVIDREDQREVQILPAGMAGGPGVVSARPGDGPPGPDITAIGGMPADLPSLFPARIEHLVPVLPARRALLITAHAASYL